MAEETDMLKQRVLRNHLAELNQTGAIAKPLKERGYLDPEGNATPLGSEFLVLSDAGLIGDDGNLTPDGELYSMNHRDSLDAPPEVYARREKLGLNQIDKESGEQGGFWSMLGDFVTEGVPRMAETAYNAILMEEPIHRPSLLDEINGTQPAPRGSATRTPEEQANAVAEHLTGGILASEPIAAGLLYGTEQLMAEIQGKTSEAYAAKQEWERHNAEITELKGAEMMQYMTGADEYMKARAALVERDGEKAVRKNEEFDRLAGNFILDPNNVLSLGAGKLATSATAAASRMTLNAEKLAMKAKVLRMGELAAKTERATLEAGTARSKTIATNAMERAKAFRDIGNEAQAIRYEATAVRLSERAAPALQRLQELSATEARLGEEIAAIAKKAGVAETIISANEKIAALKQVGPKAIGGLVESVGTGLVKTDELLSTLADRAGVTGLYQATRSLPGRLGAAATGAMTGFVPAVIPQALASGPLLQSIGNFTKILGKELIAERGSVPFWRRVANNSTISKTQRFLSHRADELTLGGRVPEIGARVAKGTVAAYPMNLALNVLADPDHDLSNAASSAFGPSLVFGGGMAGAGAIFKGSKTKMKEVRMADQINFMRNLTEDHLSGFSGMSTGAKRAVSTYGAAFPNLNWNFKHDGPNHYDPVTNTANINPTTNNPLRALVGHEVLHYVTIRNQMQPVIHAMLLGDSVTPGLVRNAVAEKSYLGPGPNYPETTPQTKPSRMRRLDTPERAKAHELLNSGDYPALTALFHSTDKIAPRNPAVALIKRRKKNGARLTNAEIRILENDAVYDGMAQALAHSTSGQGKVAREALSMLMAPHGQGQSPSSMARYIRDGATASEMWQQVAKELKQMEKRTDISTDKRNDNRENWTQQEINRKTKADPLADSIDKLIEKQSQDEDFANANNPEHGNIPIPAAEMTKGQKVTIDGEPMEVIEVVKARDSLGNNEVDYVVLKDGARFGKQVIDGGEVIYEERPKSQWDSGSYLPEKTSSPGILRNADGTLDPEFQKFHDAYQSRMDASGLDRLPIERVAEEYFNENTVDHLMSMVESGELSRMAGRTQAGRKINALIEATIPRVPILRDFFFRTGGAMEAGGRHVMGNGLLADGLRELPEARAMMRKLVRSSAGEAAMANGAVKVNDADGPGAKLPVAKGDPIIDAFHSILEVDDNGNPMKDAQGNHIALSRAKDQARQTAGFVITEAQTRRVQNGYLPGEGEMKKMDDGSWYGDFLDKPLIDALAAKGILNSKQIAIIRNISAATKSGVGHRFLITNHPALIKSHKGKIRYDSIAATLRESVPLGFRVTQKGNIVVQLMSVTQLDSNITTRAASKRGKALYDGNTEAIKQDISAMMDLHKSNVKTDKYYQDKYGPKWQEYQQFINTVFGLMTKEQRDVNPMFLSDGVTSAKDHVYRTYRLDRISKAIKMDGTPMPFGYTHVKANYLPEGVTEKAGVSGQNAISDARPDNVIKGGDGRPWPFDVMVDEVGNN
jgi:hypothetical protein